MKSNKTYDCEIQLFLLFASAREPHQSMGRSPRGSVASPEEGGRNTSGHPRRFNGRGKPTRVLSAKTKFSLKCEPGNLRAGPVSGWRGVCGGAEGGAMAGRSLPLLCAWNEEGWDAETWLRRL